MTDRVIEDLPGGWRGALHDLAVTLGLAEPTPGEQEAARQERGTTDLAREAAERSDLEAGA